MQSPLRIVGTKVSPNNPLSAKVGGDDQVNLHVKDAVGKVDLGLGAVHSVYSELTFLQEQPVR